MSLVTVQRSPTPSENGNFDQADIDASECGSPTFRETIPSTECYFYVKGTAVILLQPDRTNVGRHNTGGEIEEHLQAMLNILPPQDNLTMAVRLQPATVEAISSINHARYLAVVSSTRHREVNFQNVREVILLGLDCLPNNKVAIGVTIPIYASTRVSLDGDGGVVVDFDSSLHIFRPVSVQAMWAMFQRLHKELIETQNAKNSAQQFGKTAKRLIDYYNEQVSSDDAIITMWERSTTCCTNETSDDLGATSADVERLSHDCRSDDDSGDLEVQIYECLKEVMQTVDLDEVTSRDIRLKVEETMHIKMDKYKDFISRQMMVIMGQMDRASQIFPYLYLGTEWNACDWQWLESNGQCNERSGKFFPARLKYLKIRVSDEASTELLKYWNQTNQFIREANALQKGISRSSSTVIAFAMKEYGWALSQAMEHVKNKRGCITPNIGFVEQLKTFEGMLHAFKKRNQFDVTPSTSVEPIDSIRFRRVLDKDDRNSMNVKWEVIRIRSKSEQCAANMVKSLVGSFEAKGRGDMRDASTPPLLERRLNRPSVTFRLQNITDWKFRDRITVPVSNSCSSRQVRALTISQ
ncbi:Protein phosphatase Slingshot-like protein 1 [Dirofilaria immitis]|nr:Protein phosphatase Slingshot-like protein 1 [Dirofilaria immitis]